MNPTVDPATYYHETTANRPITCFAAWGYLVIIGKGSRVQKHHRHRNKLVGMSPPASPENQQSSSNLPAPRWVWQQKKRPEDDSIFNTPPETPVSGMDNSEVYSSKSESQPPAQFFDGGVCTFVSLRSYAEARNVFIPFVPHSAATVVRGGMALLLVFGQDINAETVAIRIYSSSSSSLIGALTSDNFPPRIVSSCSEDDIESQAHPEVKEIVIHRDQVDLLEGEHEELHHDEPLEGEEADEEAFARHRQHKKRGHGGMSCGSSLTTVEGTTRDVIEQFDSQGEYHSSDHQFLLSEDPPENPVLENCLNDLWEKNIDGHSNAAIVFGFGSFDCFRKHRGKGMKIAAVEAVLVAVAVVVVIILVAAVRVWFPAVPRSECKAAVVEGITNWTFSGNSAEFAPSCVPSQPTAKFKHAEQPHAVRITESVSTTMPGMKILGTVSFSGVQPGLTTTLDVSHYNGLILTVKQMYNAISAVEKAFALHFENGKAATQRLLKALQARSAHLIDDLISFSRRLIDEARPTHAVVFDNTGTSRSKMVGTCGSGSTRAPSSHRLSMWPFEESRAHKCFIEDSEGEAVTCENRTQSSEIFQLVRQQSSLSWTAGSRDYARLLSLAKSATIHQTSKAKSAIRTLAIAPVRLLVEQSRHVVGKARPKNVALSNYAGSSHFQGMVSAARIIRRNLEALIRHICKPRLDKSKKRPREGQQYKPKRIVQDNRTKPYMSVRFIKKKQARKSIVGKNESEELKTKLRGLNLSHLVSNQKLVNNTNKFEQLNIMSFHGVHPQLTWTAHAEHYIALLSAAKNFSAARASELMSVHPSFHIPEAKDLGKSLSLVWKNQTLPVIGAVLKIVGSKTRAIAKEFRVAITVVFKSVRSCSVVVYRNVTVFLSETRAAIAGSDTFRIARLAEVSESNADSINRPALSSAFKSFQSSSSAAQRNINIYFTEAREAIAGTETLRIAREELAEVGESNADAIIRPAFYSVFKNIQSSSSAAHRSINSYFTEARATVAGTETLRIAREVLAEVSESDVGAIIRPTLSNMIKHAQLRSAAVHRVSTSYLMEVRGVVAGNETLRIARGELAEVGESIAGTHIPRLAKSLKHTSSAIVALMTRKYAISLSEELLDEFASMYAISVGNITKTLVRKVDPSILAYCATKNVTMLYSTAQSVRVAATLGLISKSMAIVSRQRLFQQQFYSSVHRLVEERRMKMAVTAKHTGLLLLATVDAIISAAHDVARYVHSQLLMIVITSLSNIMAMARSMHTQMLAFPAALRSFGVQLTRFVLSKTMTLIFHARVKAREITQRVRCMLLAVSNYLRSKISAIRSKFIAVIHFVLSALQDFRSKAVVLIKHMHSKVLTAINSVRTAVISAVETFRVKIRALLQDICARSVAVKNGVGSYFVVAADILAGEKTRHLFHVELSQVGASIAVDELERLAKYLTRAWKRARTRKSREYLNELPRGSLGDMIVLLCSLTQKDVAQILVKKIDPTVLLYSSAKNTCLIQSTVNSVRAGAIVGLLSRNTTYA